MTKINNREKSKNYDLGILAFGSLIDNPGEEISEIEIERIHCVTPFNVEFARKSSTRSNAPTLIPVKKGGLKVQAVIIVLSNNTSIDNAKSILWRRELHDTKKKKIYIHPDTPNQNKVMIGTLTNFMNVKTVLYTSIGSNIDQQLSGELLADLAIHSTLSKAGKEEKDGIRYLLSAKRNGIVTALSKDYERQILSKTETTSLEKAIEKLDKNRLYSKD